MSMNGVRMACSECDCGEVLRGANWSDVSNASGASDADGVRGVSDVM